MRTLGLIPARGGSRGIARKNIALLGGRPLLAYTADAARASRALTRTVVSTDDREIAEAARALGLDVPFERPQPLAADAAPMLPVMQHALNAMGELGFDAEVVVLLQPTSPFRRATHIDAAIALLEASGADSVVSVVEVPHQFNPVSVMRLDGDRLRPFLDAPTMADRHMKPRVFARNGPAVLAVRASVVRDGSLYGSDSRPLVMDHAESLDIDTPWDLMLAELLLGAQRIPVS
jgi:CMP-N,N'-diacetyllegionaminic acid synthase